MPAMDQEIYEKYRKHLRAVRWCSHRKHRTNKKRDARKYGCKGGIRGRKWWRVRECWPWPNNRLRESAAYVIFSHPEWMYEVGAALHESTFHTGR